MLGQGILWGIMGLGIYLTFRILDIADLSVDGTFALGGCTCAALMVRAGQSENLIGIGVHALGTGHILICAGGADRRAKFRAEKPVQNAHQRHA